MKTLLQIIIIFSALSTSSAYGFEIFSDPFEGMPFFRVITDTLILHKESNSDSPKVLPVPIKKGTIVTFQWGVKELKRKIKKSPDGYYKKYLGVESEKSINTEIVLDNSVQRNVSPGIHEALSGGVIDGSIYGELSPDGNYREKIVHFEKEDIIEKLMYTGEGSCIFRVKGEVLYHHPCLYWEGEKGIIERKSRPVTEWWLRFSGNKKILGWMKINSDNQGNDQIRLIETIQ